MHNGFVAEGNVNAKLNETGFSCNCQHLYCNADTRALSKLRRTLSLFQVKCQNVWDGLATNVPAQGLLAGFWKLP